MNYADKSFFLGWLRDLRFFLERHTAEELADGMKAMKEPHVEATTQGMETRKKFALVTIADLERIVQTIPEEAEPTQDRTLDSSEGFPERC